MTLEPCKQSAKNKKRKNESNVVRAKEDVLKGVFEVLAKERFYNRLGIRTHE